MVADNQKMHDAETSQPRSFRRKIFYLAGFDPRGARFYHQLLGGEIARANAAGAVHLDLSSRHRAGEDVAWTVTAATGTAATGTVATGPAAPQGATPPAMIAEHHFLAWDDLVRGNWAKGPWAVLRQTLTAYRGFVSRLDWRLVRQWPRGSRVTLFYPGATLFVLPVLVLLVLWAALRLVLPTWPATLCASLTAGLVSAIVLRRIHSLWLLRFVMFNDALARAEPADELAARLDRFADTIAQTIAGALAPDGGDLDEVLFVTHSNGSILAVPVMDRVLARLGGITPENFTLVTLGCCVQLIAARRDAGWFHAALDRVSVGAFRWLDIGSLTDGACAPLVAPCQGRAMERPAGLIQLSPRWFRYADPATYKARRANKYETHFDYLRRLDRPSPLDYIAITSASQPLSASIADFMAENGQHPASP